MPEEDGDGDENLEKNTHRNGEEEYEVVKEVGLIFAVDVNKKCRNRFVRSLVVILDRSSPAVFSVTGNFENGIEGGFDSELPSSFTRKQPGPGP